MRNMQIYAVKTCKYLFKNVKYAVFLALFLAIPAPFQQALQQRVRLNSSLLVNTLRSAQFGRNRGLLTPAAPLPACRPRQAHGQPPLADPPPADGKPATAQLLLPCPPGMACRLHNQLLQLQPRPLTPPSQQQGSGQPTTPSIQHAAAHMPLPLCAQQ